VLSVADDLRAHTRSRILDLPVRARIELALALGDADLELFVKTSGLARDKAHARLTAQRARNRCVASPSATGGR
jgi:hypothetical protein